MLRVCKNRTVIFVLTALMAFGQSGPITNQRELRRSLASASTPQEHARIAEYYRASAAAYAAKQAEEERIATQWQRQYENWAKTPNPYQSARNLAAYYRERASDAISQAARQDRLSGK
jgi:hypothetical protein